MDNWLEYAASILAAIVSSGGIYKALKYFSENHKAKLADSGDMSQKLFDRVAKLEKKVNLHTRITLKQQKHIINLETLLKVKNIDFEPMEEDVIEELQNMLIE